MLLVCRIGPYIEISGEMGFLSIALEVFAIKKFKKHNTPPLHHASPQVSNSKLRAKSSNTLKIFDFFVFNTVLIPCGAFSTQQLLLYKWKWMIVFLLVLFFLPHPPCLWALIQSYWDVYRGMRHFDLFVDFRGNCVQIHLSKIFLLIKKQSLQQEEAMHKMQKSGRRGPNRVVLNVIDNFLRGTNVPYLTQKWRVQSGAIWKSTTQ